MMRLLRRIRHREAVISPQGHFLASAQGALLDGAAHRLRGFYAWKVRFRPLDADFASSRRLMNNAG